MRRGMLSVMLIMFVVVFAATAQGYDRLYTGDTAMTHDAGAFGIDVGLIYFMADSAYDQDGESVDFEDASWTNMMIPVDVYYSIMDQFEVALLPSFAMKKLDFDEGEDMEGSGITDTWFAAKYMFMPEPMMTVRVAVKVPTGTEPYDPAGHMGDGGMCDEDCDLALGSGQMDIDGAIMFGMPAGPGMFDLAVGYRYRMAQEVTVEFEDGREEYTYDYTPGSEIHFAACYTYQLSDMMNLSLAADGFFGSDDEFDYEGIEEHHPDAGEETGRNVVYINPGFEYMMENGMSIGVDMHYPLMGTNYPAEWGFGAYLGWGM